MVKRDLLIGLDSGTSVVKAVAFDLDGRQIAMESRRNSYRQLPDGGVEQDMNRSWADAAAVLKALSERVDGLAERALALGVTGQGDGTWLIDAEGAPVHDGWLWLDARAAAEAGEIAASEGMGAIYETTGTGVNLSQMRTHLVWMKRHAPELLARAATALHCKDWLYFNLTGVRASEPSEGIFTFGDFRTRRYSEEVIAALGLSDHRHLLPPIVDGAVEAHGLSESAARATGLPAGLPVSLGYVDVVCAALGAGIHDRAAAPGLSIIGSTGMHLRFAPDAGAVRLNADRCGYVMPLPGGACAQAQTNMAATLNIDWMLEMAVGLLASEGVERAPGDLLKSLDERIIEARPGAALFHPYISVAGERGPFVEPRARASFTGLDQSVGWFDMMRGVYDGLALAARDCFAAMGPTPGEIRLTGGAGRSKALRRFLAAALGAPVRTIRQEEAGAAGAVMIAAVQQGVFADVDAATTAWIAPRLDPPEAPDPALVKTYAALWDNYRQTREALTPVWAVQDEIRRRPS